MIENKNWVERRPKDQKEDTTEKESTKYRKVLKLLLTLPEGLLNHLRNLNVSFDMYVCEHVLAHAHENMSWITRSPN